MKRAVWALALLSVLVASQPDTDSVVDQIFDDVFSDELNKVSAGTKAKASAELENTFQNLITVERHSGGHSSETEDKEADQEGDHEDHEDHAEDESHSVVKNTDDSIHAISAHLSVEASADQSATSTTPTASEAANSASQALESSVQSHIAVGRPHKAGASSGSDRESDDQEEQAAEPIPEINAHISVNKPDQAKEGLSARDHVAQMLDAIGDALDFSSHGESEEIKVHKPAIVTSIQSSTTLSEEDAEPVRTPNGWDTYVNRISDVRNRRSRQFTETYGMADDTRPTQGVHWEANYVDDPEESGVFDRYSSPLYWGGVTYESGGDSDYVYQETGPESGAETSQLSDDEGSYDSDDQGGEYEYSDAASDVDSYSQSESDESSASDDEGPDDPAPFPPVQPPTQPPVQPPPPPPIADHTAPSSYPTPQYYSHQPYQSYPNYYPYPYPNPYNVPSPFHPFGYGQPQQYNPYNSWLGTISGHQGLLGLEHEVGDRVKLGEDILTKLMGEGLPWLCHEQCSGAETEEARQHGLDEQTLTQLETVVTSISSSLLSSLCQHCPSSVKRAAPPSPILNSAQTLIQDQRRPRSRRGGEPEDLYNVSPDHKAGAMMDGFWDRFNAIKQEVNNTAAPLDAPPSKDSGRNANYTHQLKEWVTQRAHVTKPDLSLPADLDVTGGINGAMFDAIRHRGVAGGDVGTDVPAHGDADVGAEGMDLEEDMGIDMDKFQQIMQRHLERTAQRVGKASEKLTTGGSAIDQDEQTMLQSQMDGVAKELTSIDVAQLNQDQIKQIQGVFDQVKSITKTKAPVPSNIISLSSQVHQIRSPDSAESKQLSELTHRMSITPDVSSDAFGSDNTFLQTNAQVLVPVSEDELPDPSRTN